MIRAVLVDDETLARKSLAVLLRAHPDIEVIAECKDGIEALEVLRANEVDLLFLDIQMPGLDGFGVLEQIETARMPAIVFVTAYDHFAVRAFELNALDYLLKPFGADRFAVSIERARKALGSGHRRYESQLQGLVNAVREPGADRLTRFLIHDNRRTYFVHADAVDYIRGCDYYAALHCGSKQHLIRQTLDELERTLDPDRFLRVHRSAIVNLDRVQELRSAGRRHQLVLKDGSVQPVSRTHKAAVVAGLQRLAKK